MSGSRLIAVAADTGRLLGEYSFTGAMFWGPPAISEGTIYVGSMSDKLFALSPSAIFNHASRGI